MLRGDQPGRDARQRYGLEIVDEIVWEIVDSAVDDLCGPGSIEERVAIGRRARDPADADRSGGAGHILDNHRLAQPPSHALGDNARNRIHLAAGRDRNDHAHRMAGIYFRRCNLRCDGEGGGSCSQKQKPAAFHLLPGVAPAEYHSAAPITSSTSAALIVAAVLRRIDIGRDGARRGADHRAWIALRSHGRQERRIHAAVGAARNRHSRSEEHTSELQSHHDLVCRLLLEKKKTQTTETAPADSRPTRRPFQTTTASGARSASVRDTT